MLPVGLLEYEDWNWSLCLGLLNYDAFEDDMGMLPVVPAVVRGLASLPALLPPVSCSVCFCCDVALRECNESFSDSYCATGDSLVSSSTTVFLYYYCYYC